MQPWVRTGIKRLVEKRLDGLRTLRISWFGGEPLYGFAAIEDLAPFFVETLLDQPLDPRPDPRLHRSPGEVFITIITSEVAVLRGEQEQLKPVRTG